MAGHSKWANIKHKKARSDERRGKEFTKIAKEIMISARSGGDIETNPKLKLMVQKAKAVNMPSENINRAIKKGTGELESEILEELSYEGYAPGGIAVLLELTTDNRNRTASDIRHIFAKNNGNLGESGCVAWMFKRVGLITLRAKSIENIDDFMLQAIDLGAEDVREDEDLIEVIAPPDRFLDIKERLEQENFALEIADIVMLPENTVAVEDETTVEMIIHLIETLEDHDDVQNVYANFSVSASLLEKLAKTT